MSAEHDWSDATAPSLEVAQLNPSFVRRQRPKSFAGLGVTGIGERRRREQFLR